MSLTVCCTLQHGLIVDVSQWGGKISNRGTSVQTIVLECGVNENVPDIFLDWLRENAKLKIVKRRDVFVVDSAVADRRARNRSAANG